MSQGRKDNGNDGMLPPKRLLLDLPNEVLTHIGEFVSANDQPQPLLAAEPARLQPRATETDLHALTHDSLRLYQANQKRLFHTVRLDTLAATTSLAASMRLYDRKRAAIELARIKESEGLAQDDPRYMTLRQKWQREDDNALQPIGPLIKRIYFPNEGLFARKDTPQDFEVNTVLMYAPALYTIFQHAINLESVFITKNIVHIESDFPPDAFSEPSRFNDALDHFVRAFSATSKRSEEARKALRHLTISCEPDSNADPSFTTVLNVPNLSSLNLVSWIPRDLSVFNASIFTSLRILRLSCIPIYVCNEQFFVTLRQWCFDCKGLERVLLDFDLDTEGELKPPRGDDIMERCQVQEWPADWETTHSVNDMIGAQIAFASGNGEGQFALSSQYKAVDGSAAPVRLHDMATSLEQVNNEVASSSGADAVLGAERQWELLRRLKQFVNDGVREGRESSSNKTLFELRIVASRRLISSHGPIRSGNPVSADQYRDTVNEDEDIFDLVQRFPFLPFRLVHYRSGHSAAYYPRILPRPLQAVPPQQ